MEEEKRLNTGENELEKILYVLKENGYQYQCVNKSKNNYGYMDAEFIKPIKYSDIDENYINDSNIVVKIQFEERLDYKNIEKDEEGGYMYDEIKANKFIESIYDKILIDGIFPKGGKFNKTLKRRKNLRKNYSRTHLLLL